MNYRFVTLLLMAACGGQNEATEEEGLALSEFNSEYGERFCAEMAICNPDMECSTDAEGPVYDHCTYDGSIAIECLDGAWSCNTESPGFEYPEPPAVCRDVSDCI